MVSSDYLPAVNLFCIGHTNIYMSFDLNYTDDIRLHFKRHAMCTVLENDVDYYV